MALIHIIELGPERTAKQAESLCQVCKVFRIPLVLNQPLSTFISDLHKYKYK